MDCLRLFCFSGALIKCPQNQNLANFAQYVTADAANDVTIAANLTILSGNSTVNTTINSTAFFSGNSTIYTTANSTTDLWVGSSTNALINSTALLIGNSTSNTSINSTAILTPTPTRNNYSNLVITSAYYIQNYAGGFVNKFRNPNMQVAQRGTSGGVTSTTAYTLDGWYITSVGGTINWFQSPSYGMYGFGLTANCASGITNFAVQQRIESNIAMELLGTTAPQTVTISFTIFNNTNATITPELRPIGIEIPFNQRYYQIVPFALYRSLTGAVSFYGGFSVAPLSPPMRSIPTAVAANTAGTTGVTATIQSTLASAIFIAFTNSGNTADWLTGTITCSAEL